MLTRLQQKEIPQPLKQLLAELDRRQVAEVSMQASEVMRRARIEGDRRDPQAILRAMGFGV